MPPEPARVGVLETAVFGVELMLLAALAVAGARLGSGTSAVVLAVVLPLALVLVWGIWLAPRSSRRVPNPLRIAAKVGAVLVAAGLLALSGLVTWPAVLFVVGVVLFALGELRGTV